MWTRNKDDRAATLTIGKRMLQATQVHKQKGNITITYTHHSDAARLGRSYKHESHVGKDQLLRALEDDSVPGLPLPH